ncbi:hypothetical protein AWW68_15550 [Roseivirga spongicola]|uniref:Uncharacterized protein n=1 Tax=Roseivirga spongicola TaxID=333140 RepID=A0A150X5S4_9BACT|nr:hypothetical protein AWW68_15550 [Roseivirga spongicola]
MLLRCLRLKFVKGLSNDQRLVFTYFFILSTAKDLVFIKAVSLSMHQQFWFRANHGVLTRINHMNRLGHRFRLSVFIQNYYLPR